MLQVLCDLCVQEPLESDLDELWQKLWVIEQNHMRSRFRSRKSDVEPSSYLHLGELTLPILGGRWLS
jgi:hypothetical protein